MAKPITYSGDLKRVYVYFSSLPISEKLFDLKGIFFSVDGKESECDATSIFSNQIAKNSLDNRLWYIDIPTQSKTCVFYIYDKNGDLWSKTSLSEINGCIYEYSTDNYSKINDISGWHNLNIQMDQFADYFLSRLNPNNSSYTDGYLCYDSLNSSVYTSIIDYDQAKEDTIKWDDEFIGSTSFSQKWNFIKTSYIANYKPEEKIIWPFFLGISLMVDVCILSFFYLKKEKIKR